jgi:hypothetical protein
MHSLDVRSIRRLAAAGMAGFLAVALSGCGTPRVHEVYRLSTTDSMSEALSAISDERLTAAQADLRQLSINARFLQPVRSRVASMSAAPSPTHPPFALDGSSSLHGCPPSHIAEFTNRSSSGFQLDAMLASARHF